MNTLSWEQPEHIRQFNASMWPIHVEIRELQKKLDRKQAFIDAASNAAFTEEALVAAE